MGGANPISNAPEVLTSLKLVGNARILALATP
jgi:hypothetical protein